MVSAVCDCIINQAKNWNSKANIESLQKSVNVCLETIKKSPVQTQIGMHAINESLKSISEKLLKQQSELGAKQAKECVATVIPDLEQIEQRVKALAGQSIACLTPTPAPMSAAALAPAPTPAPAAAPAPTPAPAAAPAATRAYAAAPAPTRAYAAAPAPTRAPAAAAPASNKSSVPLSARARSFVPSGPSASSAPSSGACDSEIRKKESDKKKSVDNEFDKVKSQMRLHNNSLDHHSNRLLSPASFSRAASCSPVNEGVDSIDMLKAVSLAQQSTREQPSEDEACAALIKKLTFEGGVFVPALEVVQEAVDKASSKNIKVFLKKVDEFKDKAAQDEIFRHIRTMVSKLGDVLSEKDMPYVFWLSANDSSKRTAVSSGGAAVRAAPVAVVQQSQEKAKDKQEEAKAKLELQKMQDTWNSLQARELSDVQNAQTMKIFKVTAAALKN